MIGKHPDSVAYWLMTAFFGTSLTNSQFPENLSTKLIEKLTYHNTMSLKPAFFKSPFPVVVSNKFGQAH